MREALGNDADVMVDAQQAWSPAQAEQRIAQLAPFRPLWIEEPMDAEVPVVYFAFDIVHLDGYDLSGSPLWQRRELLERVLLPSARISPVATIDASPEDAFRASVAAGFEGSGAKRSGRRSEPGRGRQ